MEDQLEIVSAQQNEYQSNSANVVGTSPLQLTDLPEGENEIVITPKCGGSRGARETITFTV